MSRIGVQLSLDAFFCLIVGSSYYHPTQLKSPHTHRKKEENYPPREHHARQSIVG